MTFKEKIDKVLIIRRKKFSSITDLETYCGQGRTTGIYADSNGAGEIQFVSRGPVSYEIIFVNNTFTEEGLSAYDIIVRLPGKDEFVLPNRMLIRR